MVADSKKKTLGWRLAESQDAEKGYLAHGMSQMKSAVIRE
jgi:hypothetical protein